MKITYLHNDGMAIEKDELMIIIDYAMHTSGGRGEGLLAGIVPTDLIQKKSRVLVLVNKMFCNGEIDLRI